MRQSRTGWPGGRRWRPHRHRPRDGQPGGRMGVVRLRRRRAAPLRVARRGRAARWSTRSGAARRKAMLAVLGEEGNGARLVRRPGGRPPHPRALRGRVRRAAPARGRGRQGRPRRGARRLPVPDPLVPDGPSWRFDTAAGKEEILNRRIGQNELNTIQVCLAYVDAQREYYARDPDGDALLQYAQQVRQQSRESGTGSTGRRTRASRRVRWGRSSPGRGARATPSARRTPSPTGATTTGS